MNDDKKKTIFICTGNSCRSQIAEGYMRRYFGKSYDVYSAGLSPLFCQSESGPRNE